MIERNVFIRNSSNRLHDVKKPSEYLKEYDKLLKEFRIHLENVETAKQTLRHQKNQRKRRKIKIKELYSSKLRLKD